MIDKSSDVSMHFKILCHFILYLTLTVYCRKSCIVIYIIFL